MLIENCSVPADSRIWSEAILLRDHGFHECWGCNHDQRLAKAICHRAGSLSSKQGIHSRKWAWFEPSKVGIDIDHYLWHAVTHAESEGGGTVLWAGGLAAIATAEVLPPSNCAGCASFHYSPDSLKNFVADPGGFSFSCRPGRHPYHTNAGFEEKAERADKFYLPWMRPALRCIAAAYCFFCSQCTWPL